ncbi:chorismate synthase [Actinomyces minihominis]|uniref:chorismate synthase n=1 Tax=Actinomyces minihominis TaxID=2002838 RepID=UPI000C07A5A5|nr:chorismate synthase [Actinomyces minihominis]
MITWTTAGESHGPALVASMQGVPAGVRVDTALIAEALKERRQGYGRGARQAFEQDRVEILSGVRHGFTTGAPITVVIHNSEWPKWEAVMGADPVPAEALQVDAGRGDVREMARNRPLTRPRPGHADLAGGLSYRMEDARNILERASARETAARVALGAIARQLLRQVCGTEIVSHVVGVGSSAVPVPDLPKPSERAQLQASPVRTLSLEAEHAYMAAIDAASETQETIGGIAEVIAYGVPVGLGSHVSSDRKLDAALAWGLMSIQSAKMVEIGDGAESARRLGSSAHDNIVRQGATIARQTNRAGGIEGGTSNGEPIVARVGFKPISTVPRPLPTVDLVDGTATSAFHQRSDTCQVVPGAVIAEAMVALVLAQKLTERFGGMSVAEVEEQHRAQEQYVAGRLAPPSWGAAQND